MQDNALRKAVTERITEAYQKLEQAAAEWSSQPAMSKRGSGEGCSNLYRLQFIADA
jgi:hypothetical protein